MQKYKIKLQLKIRLPSGSACFTGTSTVKLTQENSHDPVLFKMTEKEGDSFVYHYRAVVVSDSFLQARATAVTQSMDELEKNIQHDKTK